MCVQVAWLLVMRGGGALLEVGQGKRAVLHCCTAANAANAGTRVSPARPIPSASAVLLPVLVFPRATAALLPLLPGGVVTPDLAMPSASAVLLPLLVLLRTHVPYVGSGGWWWSLGSCDW